jgi:hypothetical protein
MGISGVSLGSTGPLTREELAARDERNRSREDARVARIAGAAAAREDGEDMGSTQTPTPMLNSLKLAASAYGSSARPTSKRTTWA